MDIAEGHSEQYRPLAGYAALMGAFGTASIVGLVAADRAGRLPDGFSAADLGLAAIATYKVSRLISRDRITSAIRAPFTRFQDDAGHGEVEESARGRGPRRAIGELLVCPDCVGLWVAGGFTAGLVAHPAVTRTIAATFALHAVSDALQTADETWRR
jgi:hypothetical protein